jgi:hypothetical protein
MSRGGFREELNPPYSLASVLHIPNDAGEAFDKILDPQVFAGDCRQFQFPLLLFAERSERWGDLFLVNHHKLIPSS